MVDSVNSSNKYGSIERIGEIQNNRVAYILHTPDSEVATKISIPKAECDTFERTYSDIISVAPQMEKFMQKYSTPEGAEQLKKRTRWTIGLPIAIGGLTPAILIRKAKTPIQILCATAGVIAGGITGSLLNNKLNMPPGVNKLNEASKTMSKLDIQPLV